jgi:NADH:ubiquinone reductase (H+-translocating)
MLYRVIIIGGGFSGVQLAKKLYKNSLIDLTLIDQNDESTFLPLLPDVLSKKISASNIVFSLSKWCKKRKIKFFHEKVIDIISSENFIKTTKQEKIKYDFLVVCSGSETNFYNNTLISEKAFKLDGISDIISIQKQALSENVQKVIISGGGYTGIETATHLRRLFNNNELNKDITIVEFSNELLGPMPTWIKKYVIKNLSRMNINYILDSQVSEVTQNQVTINKNEIIQNAMLIWASGVKTSSLINKLDGNKDRQGRVLVSDALKLNYNIYVCGDACQFIHKGKALRMSVRFAIDEASLIAENINRKIKNKPLKLFKPKDPGYVVPMANNKSIGIAKGVRVSGILATFLHYALCFWFSDNSNKIGIIKDLMFQKNQKHKNI